MPISIPSFSAAMSFLRCLSPSLFSGLAFIHALCCSIAVKRSLICGKKGIHSLSIFMYSTPLLRFPYYGLKVRELYFDMNM